MEKLGRERWHHKSPEQPWDFQAGAWLPCMEGASQQLLPLPDWPDMVLPTGCIPWDHLLSHGPGCNFFIGRHSNTKLFSCAYF